ncbi:MAG TPA: hypothetical protein VF715_18910 [Thermoleophilaceae bacterium]|jgi:hypothetical protein
MIWASHWQPGDRLFVEGEGTDPLVLGERIGDGAYASVFRLVHPSTEAAKIYIDPGRCPDLDLLARHLKRGLGPVTNPVAGSPLIARPTYALIDAPTSGKVVGFMMHNFRESKGWRSLPQAGSEPSLSHSAEWCLKVARKIARDVAFLHTEGLIVGDLSDANIRVTPRGDVAWIDVDSFGAAARGELAALAATGSTPECRAPELILGQEHGTQESDRFALALQVIRLLTCRFVHPHAVAPLARSRTITIEDRIEENQSWILNPHAYKATAIEHAGVNGWPDALAALCRQALRPGDRPSADEWVEVLDELATTDLTAVLGRLAVAPAPRTRPPRRDGGRTGTGTPVRRPGAPAPRGPAPKPRQRRQGGLAWTIVSVAVVVALVAGAIVAADGSRSPDQPAGNPPATGPSANDLAKLDARIPAAARGCMLLNAKEPGVAAAKTCRAAGVDGITYRLLRSTGTLDGLYRSRAAAHGAKQDRGSCPVSPPSADTWTYSSSPKVVRGSYMCLRESGVARYEWTLLSKLLYIQAWREDGSVQALHKRWASGDLE